MLSYRQFFLLFLFLLSFIHLSAQEVNPVTRFHTYGSPYVDYNDNFFSGFMQSADSRQKGGFLQMPFIGNPVLVYIGEKDSTQFMAYASGYEFQQRHPETGHYAVDITRYGVHVETESTPTTLIQRFTFPDTTAVKGFLLDIDNSGSGKGNEDMNVYFIDKRTIRAYKRGNDDGSAGQYYYARFSHPFDSWNVRRERVTLSDGRKEARCKAAFTFPLKQGEQLIVRSSVSSVSSDLAYTRVEGKAPGHHFDDKRYIFNNDQSQVTQTTNSSKSTTSQSSRKPNPASPVRDQTRQPGTFSREGLPYIEVTTSDATLRAAFYAALDQLSEVAEIRRAHNAAEFITALTPLYKEEAANATPAVLDSLLRVRAGTMLTGGSVTSSPSESVWFVFNALGFVPTTIESQAAYRLRRPLFNIVTLDLPHTRRLIIHTKNNTATRPVITSATFMRHPLSYEGIFTHEQLLSGGVLQLQMGR